MLLVTVTLKLILQKVSNSDTNLYQTLSDQSPHGSPGCLHGPFLHESAAGLAASASVSALFLKSPVGADSSGPSLQVSEKRNGEEVSVPHKPKVIHSNQTFGPHLFKRSSLTTKESSSTCCYCHV